jgi:hypothetical protein
VQRTTFKKSISNKTKIWWTIPRIKIDGGPADRLKLRNAGVANGPDHAKTPTIDKMTTGL